MSFCKVVYLGIAKLPIIFLLIQIGACKKLVDIEPPETVLSDQSIFKKDATAISVLTGIYASMSAPGDLPTISKKAGLSADELSLWNGADNYDRAYYTNSLASTNQIVDNTVLNIGHEFWSMCYAHIFRCNTALEGLSLSASLSTSVKQQLLGEARFLRAFFYFYLVNLYGDVPIVTKSDYEINRSLPNSNADEVYKFIISDLIVAKSLLSEDYLDGKLEPYNKRLRPNRSVASALLARTYLYNGQYSEAEQESSTLINKSGVYGLPALSEVFLENSIEAIWQLQPISMNGSEYWNTEDAKSFVLSAEPVGFGGEKSTFLSSHVMAAFDSTDNRLKEWVGTYIDFDQSYFFPYKYKVASPGSDILENLMVFRLAEQYLIRAEARARLNNLSGAAEDLNAVRTRAGLLNTEAFEQSSLVDAILRERQVELFVEWGHRWLDLKRTGHVDQIMSVVTPLKSNGKPWRSYQQKYPLPFDDIQRNPNLRQNTGY